MYKQNPNTPIHFFCDNTPYFITARIYKNRPLLANNYVKNKLLNFMQKAFFEENWNLQHWVILDNHYHLLVNSCKGIDLPKIIQNIHKLSGFLISQTVKCEKPIWWNYWDYCPRNEKEYLIRLNYLLYNPIKHGYVTDLKDYPFSSFHSYFNKVGRKYLAEQFLNNPEYKELKINGEID